MNDAISTQVIASSATASGLTAIYTQQTVETIGVVVIVTMAARLFMVLGKLESGNTWRELFGIISLAMSVAICTAIITFAGGVAFGIPLNIVAVLSTVFGAQPQILQSIIEMGGREVKRQFRKGEK